MTRRTFAHGGFRTRGDGATTRGDISTVALVGLICAIVGFFWLGIVLGPVALVCGWLAMDRSWRGRKPVLAVIAVLVGALDTVIALLYLSQ